MRLFLAIDLDDVARAAAEATTRDLQRRLEEGRIGSRIAWVRRENLHVTLRFLGEMDAEGVERLRQALAVPFVGSPFETALGPVGVFPAGGPPQVMWIGLEDGAADLRALHAEVESRLVPIGFPPASRIYHPHVTIARIKNTQSREARRIRDILGTIELARAPFSVNAVRLYQSRLSPMGSVYTPVLDTPMIGSGGPG
jgi:RNA 2',3'-cyclic 3'-phosphodiesterase